MSSSDINDIKTRLNEFNAEEGRLLANIQVSLAGIERIHAQRRIEELTLLELRRKAEDDRRGEADRNLQRSTLPELQRKAEDDRRGQGNKGPQTKQEQQGKQRGGRNRKRGSEDQPKRPWPAKRPKYAGPSGVNGIPLPIPSPCRQNNSSKKPNQPRPGEGCKCLKVDVQCKGSSMSCEVCKALGCAGIVRSRTPDQNMPGTSHGKGKERGVVAPGWADTDTINVDLLGP